MTVVTAVEFSGIETLAVSPPPFELMTGGWFTAAAPARWNPRTSMTVRSIAVSVARLPMLSLKGSFGVLLLPGGLRKSPGSELRPKSARSVLPPSMENRMPEQERSSEHVGARAAVAKEVLDGAGDPAHHVGDLMERRANENVAGEIGAHADAAVVGNVRGRRQTPSTRRWRQKRSRGPGATSYSATRRPTQGRRPRMPCSPGLAARSHRRCWRPRAPLRMCSDWEALGSLTPVERGKLAVADRDVDGDVVVERGLQQVGGRAHSRSRLCTAPQGQSDLGAEALETFVLS